MATSASDSVMRIWNDDGDVTAGSTDHKGEIIFVEWRPDGKAFLSSSADLKLRVSLNDPSLSIRRENK